jgi:translation initiation factor 4E
MAAAAVDATNSSSTASSNTNSALVTVFEDPINFNAKHPLNGRWTLWFDNPNNKRPQSNNWDASLKNLITIETVEDFWG